MRIWLPAKSDLMLIGPWLNEVWVAYAASWVGAIFDSTIVFFLLNKKPRRPAYALVILFHVATWLLFNIGMFPWIMIVGATLLFPADWPRSWLSRISAFVSNKLNSVWLANRFKAAATIGNPPRLFPAPKRSLLLWPVGIYAMMQLALPLRSYFFAQPPAWTGSGFNCAWRVMLVEKSGYAEFHAFDPTTGRRWKLPARDYLTRRQEMTMAQDPYLVRAMARRMATDLKQRGFAHIQVQADSFATLNGRPSQRLINPHVDLAGSDPASVPLSN